MEQIFLLSAAVGGCFLAYQFLSSLLGMGADHAHVSGGESAHLGAANLDHAGGHVGGADVGHELWSDWLVRALSFRTIVAALTLFGLSGMASLRGGFNPALAGIVALIAGAVALFSVHGIMTNLMRLRSDGTLRIHSTLGARGTVYIPIPPGNQGQGKVQLKLSDRIVELKAQTAAAQRLPTGAMVIVTDILTRDTVLVEPLPRDDTRHLPG